MDEQDQLQPTQPRVPPPDATTGSLPGFFPWFAGGPWIPKFGVDKCEQFGEWKRNIEVCLRALALNSKQQVDLVMGALEGEPKREVELLEEDKKDTVDKILKFLEQLYGREAGLAELRGAFFTCRQHSGEGVGSFILRLRECRCRWRKKEPTEGDDNDTLRSQLVAGMLMGPAKRELQRMIRRNPGLTFAEACMEAREVEREGASEVTTEGVESRRAYVPPSRDPGAPPGDPPAQPDAWRTALKEELVQELRNQVKELRESLLGELRTGMTLRGGGGPPSSDGPLRGRSRQGQGTGAVARWDDQGRPICLHCGRVGHMRRECPDRRALPRDPPAESRAVRPLVEGEGVEPALREALVGDSPLVQVLAAGRPVSCIIDTGSQVTLFSKALFEKQVQGVEMRGAHEVPWLTLKAVNGLKLPYVGYVVLDFTVAGVVIPQRGVVIVEDQHLPASHGILGMNVIRHCWEVLEQQGGANHSLFVSALPRSARAAWSQAFAACRRLQVTVNRHEEPYLARLRSSGPPRLQPQSECVVWADVPRGQLRDGDQVLVEDFRAGHQEWCVGRALARVRDGRVPLRVCNLHAYPVELPVRRPLASVERVGPDAVQLPNELVLRPQGEGTVEVMVRPVGHALPQHLQTLGQQGEGLSPEEKRQLHQLLEQWQRVFARDEDDHGRTDAVYHHIPTGTAAPIRERYRPVPPSMYPEIKELLRGMLEGGVIRESSSPWAAPVVLVRKKDGAWRFCVDYRRLNDVTHKDAYPLPRIEESLTSLKGAAWYSTLDLASGYWQVEVHPDDQEKTAFATPMGLYQFERMPFGLCNAPATFQRLMQRCLGDKVHDFLLIYLDDVILFSSDFSSHLAHLEQVFARLEAHGLKLQPAKCSLFQRSVKYLGHVVGADGVSTDPEKTAAVQDWPVPTTVKEVRSFLGFVGYYRRFIPGFSKLAAPLHTLLRGVPAASRGRVQWSDTCQEAFDGLKRALVEAPVLAYADYTLPFRLYTDASLQGLGAVLAQVQGGKERVIAYASRGLHDTEKNDNNYSAFKLELLALKWAITEKLKDYLWGMKFIVFTDHRPLLHLKTASLGAVEQRWAGQLACYDFTLHHKPGREHLNADALSRQPGLAVVGQVGTGDDVDWAERQGQDPALAQVRRAWLSGVAPTTEVREAWPWASQVLLRNWDRLKVQQGVLLYQVNGKEGWAVVVPEAERHAIWREYHEALGHARGRRLVSALQIRFFWPGLKRDVETWEKQCPRCLIGSAGRIPTRDQTAETAARLLWREVFQRYGCPERLLSDQGPAFEATLLRELCRAYGCKKIRTTPYRPQGNGACERWNQTLLGLLNTLTPAEQQRWTEHLPDLLQAYNSTPHSSTGLAPFFVLFGRHPRLPVDQSWGVGDNADGGNGGGWLWSHRRRLKNAIEEVQRKAGQRQEQDQRRHQHKVRGLPLVPGERVLVRSFRRRAHGKLGPYWNPGPQVVVGQPDPQGPVYRVRPEGQDGPLRTLHRRHLRVCPPGCELRPPETAGERVGGAGPDVCPRWGGQVLGWPGLLPSRDPQGVEAYEAEEAAPGETEVLPGPAEAEAPMQDLEGMEGGEPEEVDGALRRSLRTNLGQKPVRYRP
ncbi:uncharacterized protein LOC134069109 [Sardina pilchardus]|uniref:uncharacterized protein LOC134069109 n=1 Tax=Sardina pilchardus TaxID=27697 RepID=UPI002E0E846B